MGIHYDIVFKYRKVAKFRNVACFSTLATMDDKSEWDWIRQFEIAGIKKTNTIVGVVYHPTPFAEFSYGDIEKFYNIILNDRVWEGVIDLDKFNDFQDVTYGWKAHKNRTVSLDYIMRNGFYISAEVPAIKMVTLFSLLRIAHEYPSEAILLVKAIDALRLNEPAPSWLIYYLLHYRLDRTSNTVYKTSALGTTHYPLRNSKLSYSKLVYYEKNFPYPLPFNEPFRKFSRYRGVQEWMDGYVKEKAPNVPPGVLIDGPRLHFDLFIEKIKEEIYPNMVSFLKGGKPVAPAPDDGPRLHFDNFVEKIKKVPPMRVNKND